MPGAAAAPSVCHGLLLAMLLTPRIMPTIPPPPTRGRSLSWRPHRPTGHAEPRFPEHPGGMARRAAQQGRTCHTRESCIELFTQAAGNPSAKLPARAAGVLPAPSSPCGAHRRPMVEFLWSDAAVARAE